MRFSLASLLLLLPACTGAGPLPLEDIRLPPGFSVSVFAEVPGAREMALSDDGVVYVGNRGGDEVRAVRDADHDGKAEQQYVIAENLDSPNGVAWRDGDLFVAEASRILRFRNVDQHLDRPPAPQVVTDDYPDDGGHDWKFIAFGPDGKLYVPIGAPCNICDRDGFSLLTRLDVESGEREVFARGIRSTQGFDWDPATGDLWFTENGRDWLGDNRPDDELNRATRPGQHFGYPYCHAGDIADPEYGEGHDCTDYVAPAAKLGAHVAPLGLAFYTGSMFPGKYRGGMFIAEHGSWNRSEKAGYRLIHARPTPDGVVTGVFASGWLEGESAWGRPVDVLVMPDGALLVSDDRADVIYRIAFNR